MLWGCKLLGRIIRGGKIMCQVKNNKIAQSSLETTIALACAFLLLLGGWKVFYWVNQIMVKRQVDYEESRVRAGSSNPGEIVDESGYPKLNIFNEIK